MSQIVKLGLLSIVALIFMAAPALAQGPMADAGILAQGGVEFSGAIGAGLVCIGSAYGIGRLAGCAMESMARQPEVAGNVQTGMIIAAALIEGFTFFALIICMQQNPWG